MQANAEMELLQYPIGQFDWRIDTDASQREHWLGLIADTPAQLRRAVSGLTRDQLDTPYRPGGWTVRQVVHHYADDHMNSYVRFKLALTEEAPVIKPYSEPLWAEVPEARCGPIEPSLDLLAALHVRWVAAWRALKEGEWARVFQHVRRQRPISLHDLAALYAWHGRHHVAQVRALRTRSGWD
jgi:hypothetical protein